MSGPFLEELWVENAKHVCSEGKDARTFTHRLLAAFSRRRWPQEGRRVHGPGFLRHHLKPATQVCSQFWIKSLRNYVKVQVRSTICLNHRMTEVKGIVEMIFTNNRPKREFSSSTTLTGGIPASVRLHPGTGCSLPHRADHFHIWTVKVFWKCF